MSEQKKSIHLEGRYQILAAIITVIGSIMVVFITKYANAESNEDSFTKIDCSCSNNRMYKKGLDYYLKMSYEEAFKSFSIAKEEGCVESIYFLGRMKLNGEGVEENKIEAKNLYELAINKGDLKGYYGLGNISLADNEFKSNPKADNYFSKAIKPITECANGGHIFWKTNLGYTYKHGNGVSVDEKKAKELLLEPANEGYGRAQFMLAEIYDYSEIFKDKELAISWYKKAANNFPRHGYPEFALGYIYDNDEKYIDKDEGFKWYLKSANKGHSTAQYNIGVNYYNSKEYVKALKWFEKSAEQKYSEAVNYLGIFYQYGFAVEKNLQKALEYFLEGAELGSSYGNSNVGGIYIEQKKFEEAYPWLVKATESKQKLGQYFMGYLYEQENFSKHDYEQAVYWYSLAIQNNTEYRPYHRLGLLYLYGNGVQKNIDKAIEYLEIAATNNYSPSQYALGYVLVTEKEEVTKGLEWLKKASKNNVKEAKYLFGVLITAIIDESTNDEDIDLAEEYLDELANENYKEARAKLKELDRKIDALM